MAEFTKDEKLLILASKEKLKDLISDFTLTIKKLNGAKDYTKCFFITGGVIGSLLRGEKYNDIDIWFYEDIWAANVVRLYTKDPLYMNQVEVFDEKYRDIVGHPGGMMITENAVTLKNNIQLITRHCGWPDTIRETFDFVHCLPYYNSYDDMLYISYEQYQLNMNKQLKINNTKKFNERRLNKFLDRGWRATWQ